VGRRRRRGERFAVNAEINVVSLIDVMMLMMVIFMITAPMLQGGVDVALPRAEARPLEQKGGMTVTVARDGGIYVDETRLTPEEFAGGSARSPRGAARAACTCGPTAAWRTARWYACSPSCAPAGWATWASSRSPRRCRDGGAGPRRGGGTRRGAGRVAAGVACAGAARRAAAPRRAARRPDRRLGGGAPRRPRRGPGVAPRAAAAPAARLRRLARRRAARAAGGGHRRARAAAWTRRRGASGHGGAGAVRAGGASTGASRAGARPPAGARSPEGRGGRAHTGQTGTAEGGAHAAYRADDRRRGEGQAHAAGHAHAATPAKPTAAKPTVPPPAASAAKPGAKPDARPGTAPGAAGSAAGRPGATGPAGPRAGGGPEGGQGADVANVSVAGLKFPYPGYLANIVRQVALRFTPPGRTTLSADVAFLIHRDGSVTDVRIVRRSGNYGFDLEARGAVEAAGESRAFGHCPRGSRTTCSP
jgi:hypothetical protein